MAESITITDNRTGESLEIPIANGGVAAAEWSKLLPGVWFYDPGFMSTAACESAITFLDGEAGILRYRGYPIEQLAEHSTYLEVAYLLLHGELPTEDQFEVWQDEITMHTFIHENMRKRFLEGFHSRRPPHGHAGCRRWPRCPPSTSNAKEIFDPARLATSKIIRLIVARCRPWRRPPTASAWGCPTVYPDNTLDFSANFLSDVEGGRALLEPDPVLAKALDILFILHADHEQNCSTTAMRVVGSSHSDPYSACAASCAALYGPRHGGANEEVIKMLTGIGSIENVPAFIESVKAGHGRLQGFGHRVYKNYDPRAKIIKRTADEVFAVTGKNPLLDIALALEEIALSDEYFTSRRLYPNVDFYSGLIYQAMQGSRSRCSRPCSSPSRGPAGWLAAHLAEDARPGVEDLPAPASCTWASRPATTRALARRAEGASTGSPGARPSWTIETTESFPPRSKREAPGQAPGPDGGHGDAPVS